MRVNITLNVLEGKLPVVIKFSVSLYELNILMNDRVTVSVGAVSETQTHTHTQVQTQRRVTNS